MIENKLKPIPYTAEKSQVKKMYNNTPSRLVHETITAIVQKSLEKSKNYSSRTNECIKLLHPELVEIVSVLGTPKGYFLTPEFEKSLQQFEFEQKSLKQISLRIELCAKEIRGNKITRKTYFDNVELFDKIVFKYNLSTETMIAILGFKEAEDETES